MKSLQQHINEKLVINKNLKQINLNNEFYKEFKNTFQYITAEGYWNCYGNVKWIPELTQSSPAELTFEILDKINEIFKETKNKNSIFHFCTKSFKNDTELMMYNNIVKYLELNKENIEFKIYEELTINYCIWMFESDEIIFAIIGPDKVNNMSEDGNILFKYKK